MSDTSDPDSSGAGAPEIQRGRRSILGRISLVWLVPVAALLVSFWVVFQSWQDQGRLISVVFEDASGVRAEETQLRYRDVVVGLVEAVRFTDELDRVLVDIRLDSEVGEYVDEEAQFWIVAPQVSAQGVSGLDTVLGGVYIEGSWDGNPGDRQQVYDGRQTAPLQRYGQEGLVFRLRAPSVAGLSENAPILYRGINVGQVGALRLADDGVSVIAEAFVRSPESQLITSATRFWDTSGFTFSFGANGAQLNVQSIASLVQGGVAFDTIVSGGAALEELPTFRLYDTEEEARSSVFSGGSNTEPVSFAVLFDESVPGLEVGADVEFAGINVGRVAALTGVLDEAEFGDGGVRLLTTIEVQPGRMGLDPTATPEEVLDFMEFAVSNGLRARLQNASLLGGLQISLVQLDDVAPAEIDAAYEPYPLIPSVDSELSDFADTAEGVFNRVNALPIEELLGSAIQVLNSTDRLLNQEGVQETPQEVLGLLTDFRGLVRSEGVQGIPGQIDATLAAFQSTAEQLQAIVTELNDAEAVAALVDALEAAEEAADSVYETMDEGPETLAEINEAVNELTELIATVNDLPLASVVDETEGTIAALRTLIAAPATQGITGDVSALLNQVEGLVADVREAGLVETADATLTDLRGAVTELSAELGPLLGEARLAVSSARTSIGAVPTLLQNVDVLVNELSRTAADVNALPLDQVVADVEETVAAVRDLVASPGIQAVPGDVSSLLAEIEALVAQVSESGVIASTDETIEALGSAITQLASELVPLAANARAASRETLPGILQNIETVTEELAEVASEVSELPLTPLVAEAQATVTALRSLVASDAVQAVPADVSALLTDLQAVVTQISESGIVTTADDTLRTLEVTVTELNQSLTDVLDGASDRVPAILANVETITAELAQLANQVNGLPLSTLVGDAQATVASIRDLVASEDVQAVPAEVSALLAELQSIVAQVNASGLVGTADETLAELQRAIGSLTASLTPILETASARVPGLLTEIDGVAAELDTFVTNLNTLPLDSVVGNVNGLLASVTELINTEGVQSLPQDVTATLTEAQTLLRRFTEGGLIDQAEETLLATETAIADIQAQLAPVLAEAQIAAARVAEASGAAPEVAAQARQIADRIEALVNEAAALPLEEIGTRTSTLLDSANALVSSEQTQRVPEALANTLEEVQRLLIQVQEGGLIENANSTLAAAESAASAVADASDQIPGLLTQVGSLLSQTETVIEGYQTNGPVGSQAQRTLREIQDAAQSVDSLARAIERSPNSLIFGR